MNKNSLLKLGKLGQSVWLDYLSRDMIESGKLAKMIGEDGVTGITSNPTIFQSAISKGNIYEGAIKKLLSEGAGDKEIFERLATEDVAGGADALRPVYEKTKCVDGYVSIEVAPDLAYDTEATVAEAKRLKKEVGRENIYIKVPATKQGLPAIEELISEGVSVNVTLLFSVDRYVEVMHAYIRGLEQALKRGRKVQEINSVASFFVSRVDTLVDSLLSARLEKSNTARETTKIKDLLGKAAVANAKLAYKKYRGIFDGKYFSQLTSKGAHVQRILWASTGTKNKDYSDIKYIQELVAKDSVNTMPEGTMYAFKDHGEARYTVGEASGAEKVFKELESLGIDFSLVSTKLEIDGVKAFMDSYFNLLDEIARKRASLVFGV